MLLGAFAVLPLPMNAEDILDLRVTLFGNRIIEIKAWYNSTSKSYDLFLPADCDHSAMTVAFLGGDTLKVGKPVLKTTI